MTSTASVQGRQLNEQLSILDVLYKYKNHVLPAFNKFILPHKDKSDFIVNNSKNNNSAPEAILEYIIKESGIN